MKSDGGAGRRVGLLLLLLVFLGCFGEGEPARAQAMPRMDGDRAMAHLRAQTDFGPRVPGTEAHRRTRDYLVETLRRFANEVLVQSFPHETENGSVEMVNVVATFGPDGPDPILLSAHWDSRPFADQEEDPDRASQPIPGANDGASGVAVLLEIARQMKAVPPPVPVTIVLFDGEDWGRTAATMFVGSRYYAANPIPTRPKYGILVDMVGDADLRIPIEPISQRAAPWLIDALWRIAEEIGIDAFVREMGPPIQDDHVPLIRAGIPTVNLIDFTYPYWHTLEDTPDKCAPESLAAVGDVILRYLYTR